MRGFRVAFFSVMAGFAARGICSEWLPVAETDSNQTEIDRAGITIIEYPVIKAWFMRTFVVPDKNGVKTQKFLYYFDCKKKTMALGQYVHFDKSGNSLATGTIRLAELDYSDAVPESIGEDMLYAACIGAIAKQKEARQK